MKNFSLPGFIAILLSQFFIFSTAFAASDPAIYFPADLPYYLEIDANQQHPLKDSLKDLLTENLEIDTNSNEAEILLKNIDSTKLAIGFMDGRINSQPIMLAAFSLEQSSFDQLIKSDDVDISDIGSNKKVYQIGEGFYFTYLGGNLIGSNEFGLISDLLLTKNTQNFHNSENFQNFQKNIANPGFLKLFINLEKLFQSADLSLPESAYLNLSKLFKTEGISLAQNSSGFNAEVYIELAPDSTYPLNNHLFTPEIYKKINADKLAFYQESYNLNSQLSLLSSSLGLGQEFDILFELKPLLKSELDLDWDTEIAPLLDKRLAFTMHNSNQIFPGLSLIAETNNSSIAKSTNQKLINKITELLNQELDNSYQTYLDDQDFYQEYYPDLFQATVTKEEFNKNLLNISNDSTNGKFTTFTLSKNKYAQSDEPDFSLSISLGFTNDGNWVITTQKLSDLFNNTGLLADQEFSKNYQNRTQKVTEISYLNFPNLKNYLETLFTTISGNAESPLPVELALFLDPLQSMYSETTSVGSKALKSNIKINLDIAKLSNYQLLFDKLMQSNFIDDLQDFNPDQIGEDLESSTQHCLYFSDVNANEWYSSYVSDVCFNNIMTGFDNEFKPNQAITRAEFIKTIISAQDYLGYYYTTVEPETYFSDVNSSAWYASSINKARAHQIIEGFNDNTFRPNQPITRAEAIQILYNLNTYPETFPNPNFQDVSNENWFYQAVAYGKDYGIISGKTNNLFAPQDNLTRAETAKIISNYLNQ